MNSGKQGIPFKQLKRLSTGNVVQYMDYMACTQKYTMVKVLYDIHAEVFTPQVCILSPI